MTNTQQSEAIQALSNGEFDNEQLLKIGFLFPDKQKNIEVILGSSETKPNKNDYNFGFGHNEADNYYRDLKEWQTRH